ncbi:MAG: hypothetical protein H2B03_07950, partial [Nitrosopumilaceae archaeon]|nr:hypothetical protein [Nitrosopumilaceae archaeon]
MAAHVAVTDYSVYQNWSKNKTPRTVWKVIDFIEDNAVERYLNSTNPDVWGNISQISRKYMKFHENPKKESQFALKIGSKMLDSVKEEMSHETLQMFDRIHQKNILNWANQLYKNSKILQNEIPSYYEQHGSSQSLLLQKNKIEFFPSGKFQNT